MPGCDCPAQGPSHRWIGWSLIVAIGLISYIGMTHIVRTARPGYIQYSDCTAYVLQAETFLHGRLTTPAAPQELSDFFNTFGMVRHNGREFSRQPPGASALLAALGLLLGDIRLAPPVISAVAIVLSFAWIRRVCDTRTAVLATCLYVFSLMYLLAASSVLSYPPSGLMAAGAILLFSVSVQRKTVWTAFFCGLVVGLHFTIRPFTATLMIIALGTTRLVLFRDSPRAIRQVLAFAGGLLPGVALLLLHNWAITGNVWPLAFSLYDSKDHLGFGVRGLGAFSVDHTVARGLGNLVNTCRRFLGRAPFPDAWYLALLPIAVWWLGRIFTRRRTDRGKLTRWDVALVLMAGVLVGGHVFYWAPRPICYFEVYPIMAALTARGVWYMSGSGWVPRLAAWPIVGLAMLPVLYAGPRVRDAAAEAKAIRTVIDQSCQAEGPLLVFVRTQHRELGQPTQAQSESDEGRTRTWLLHRLFNHPLTRETASVVYAVDLGPKNKLLARHYPGHRPKVLRALGLHGEGQSRKLEWALTPIE